MVLAPSANTDRLPRFSRLGARKVSRAHLQLSARSAALSGLAQATAAIAKSLEAQLGAPVQLQARLLPTVAFAPGAASQSSGFAVIELAAPGSAGVLEVELDFIVALLERLCGRVARKAPAAQLTRIERAAFGFLCATAISAVRDDALIEARFSPRLLSVSDRRDAAFRCFNPHERLLCVEVRISVDGLIGSARFFVAAHSIQAAVQSLPVGSPAAGTAAPRFDIPLELHMGRAQLNPKDLVGLAPRDVVVFDGMRIAQGAVTGPVRLSGARFHITGELSLEGLAISQSQLRSPPTELSMKEKNDATCLLPIELEVELARVQLPVQELAAVRPGAVVPLRVNAADAVIIKVGDRPFAKAELVDVEGEVGARIISLL